jgi:NAD+ kinase
LANNDECGLIALVTEALAGELARDSRSLLSIEVVCEGEEDPYGEDDDVNPLQSGKVPAEMPLEQLPLSPLPADRYGVNTRGLSGVRKFYALNEAAITRGSLGRIIEFSLSISGIHVARMRGDGLVVSTATGSTAYALSAGGPLVSPGFKGMLAVPLAPHTLNSRTIATDSNDVIEVLFDDIQAYREAALFIDGEIVLFDSPLRKLYIKRAPFDITLLRGEGAHFYDRIAQDFYI